MIKANEARTMVEEYEKNVAEKIMKEVMDICEVFSQDIEKEAKNGNTDILLDLMSYRPTKEIVEELEKNGYVVSYSKSMQKIKIEW